MLLSDFFKRLKLNASQFICNSFCSLPLAELFVPARRVYLTYKRFHPTPDDDLW